MIQIRERARPFDGTRMRADLLLVEAQDLQRVERGRAREGDVGLTGLEDLAEVDAHALERLALRLVDRDGPGQDDGELREVSA